MSSEQDNKAIVRSYFEGGFGAGNLDVIDEVFDPEHRILNPHIAEGMRGPEPMKSLVLFSRKILPDLEVAVEDDTVEGDKVVTRWTLTGGLADRLRTSDPGEQVTISGRSVSRVSGGKIKETRLRCETDLQEPRRPMPRDEFREWLLEDTPSPEGAPSLRFPIPEDWASRFCCLLGLRFCCHELQPPFAP